MENKNRSGIFLGVIGVATLIVAIIGATFAFFTAQAGSADDEITAGSTKLALGYEDTLKTNLKANLIPAADNIAIYAANNQNGKEKGANNQCVDDNANEVCSVYEFTIGNPNKTTAQTLYFSLQNVDNNFAHLYYAVYELQPEPYVENSPSVLKDADPSTAGVIDPVIAATPVIDAMDDEDTDVLPLLALNQTLAPSKNAADADVDLNTVAKLADPASYTLYTQTIGTVTQYNKRTYRMIFWIHEAGQENVNADEEKTFKATLLISTSDGETGVTGQIASAG